MLLEEMKLRTAARIVADGGRVAQRQYSLSDQLADLHHLAVAFGLYDADDYVRTTNALLAAKCVELAALREAAQAFVDAALNPFDSGEMEFAALRAALGREGEAA